MSDTKETNSINTIKTIVCPMCGGTNSAEAVFCANPACHKSLGEFRYIAEELRTESRWHEEIAEKVTDFIGRPHYLLVNMVLLVVWIGLNTGLIMTVRRFDVYPFGLLGFIFGVESLFITGFVLISQNRQNTHATRLAELDYEVNVKTFRKLREIEETLLQLQTEEANRE